MRLIKIITACMLLVSFAMAVPSASVSAASGSKSSARERMKAEAAVKQSAMGLADSYQNEDARGFMALVSDRFTGDTSSLDSAVRHDFSAFTDISVRLMVDGITFDGTGNKAFVTVTFTQEYTEVGSSARKTRNGSTFFVFCKEGGAWKLYSVGTPLVFGIS